VLFDAIILYYLFTGVVREIHPHYYFVIDRKWTLTTLD